VIVLIIILFLNLFSEYAKRENMIPIIRKIFKIEVGAINFEYENIKLKNGEIKKQSGELKAKLFFSEKWTCKLLENMKVKVTRKI